MPGFNFGVQEILLLFCCIAAPLAAPLAAVAAAFLVGRRSARKSPPGGDEF